MTDQTTSPLTEQQLDAIEARATAATPGPWEEHAEYDQNFYAYLRGPYLRGVGTLNFGDGEDAAADREFVLHAREDVPALLAEIVRLKGQRKYLIGQLAKRDAETGRGDRAVREFLGGEPTDAPDSLPAWLRQRFTASGASWENLDAAERSYWEHQARAVRRAVERGGFKTSPTGAAEQPAVAASEACGKCKQPFDPADTAFDGRARYHLTPYCRGCVDRCHDNEITDHRCVICA